MVVEAAVSNIATSITLSVVSLVTRGRPKEGIVIRTAGASPRPRCPCPERSPSASFRRADRL